MDKKKLLLISIVFVLIAGATLIYYRGKTAPSSITTALSPTPFQIPSDWQTYKSEANKFEISHPTSYEVSENGENSILITPKGEGVGVGPTNFIYVSYVPEALKNNNDGTIYNYSPLHIKKLEEAGVGESVSIADAGIGQDEWYTYTRLDDVVIGGVNAKVYENKKPWEFPAGTVETRYILNLNNDIYLLGYYSGGDSNSVRISPEEASNILQSLKIDK